VPGPSPRHSRWRPRTSTCTRRASVGLVWSAGALRWGMTLEELAAGAGAAGGVRGGGVRHPNPGVIRSRRCSSPARRSRCPHPPSARTPPTPAPAPPATSVSVTRWVEWTRLTASGSWKGDPPSRRACRSARRMISSSSRSRRWRRVTGHRLRRCRRESHPNSCIGGGPGGSHGRRAVSASGGCRSRRQHPRRAWRGWWRSGLLVPSLGWLIRKPHALAGRASGLTPAASRMAVAESSVAPPCDEVGREDAALTHSLLFPDCSASLYPGRPGA
jgi:hypothetical protein